MDTTIEVDLFETVTVHRLTLRAGTSWAIVTLDDTKGSGQVTISSDYGSYSYHWPRNGRGNPSLAGFLHGVSDGYLANKLGGPDVEDVKATRKGLIQRLLEGCRHREGWTYDPLLSGLPTSGWMRTIQDDQNEAARRDSARKDHVRQEYDRLVRAESVDELIRDCIIPDAWEATRNRPDPRWAMFWKVFGPRLRAALGRLADSNQGKDHVQG